MSIPVNDGQARDEHGFIAPIEDKDKLRSELKFQVCDFLSTGGKIRKFDCGEVKVEVVEFNNRPINAKTYERRFGVSINQMETIRRMKFCELGNRNAKIMKEAGVTESQLINAVKILRKNGYGR